jgi:YjbE family integral membrane protein
MDLIAEIQTAHFWAGLMTIIWVNIILSGDNAVVIALAARSLPKHQQNKAVFWGAGAAVVLRIILTLFAVALLKYPYLKIVGGLLLFWIAVNLLMPEDGDQDIESSDNLIQAIKTILIADLVMSVDNVIAVAAAAKGSIVLLVLGLLISIPLVIFGATLLMKLMERYPIIITVGAALIGMVAGEMLVTDPVVADTVRAAVPWMDIHLPFGIGELSWAQIAGAVLVVAVGKWLAARAKPEDAKMIDLAAAAGQPLATGSALRILMPVDGSENSLRTVGYMIDNLSRYRELPEIHLLNVQHALPGTIRGVGEEASRFHQEEGIKALARAREKFDAAGVRYNHHIGVGDFSETIAQYVKNLNIEQVVMGCRGASPVANMMLGSVASRVLQLIDKPVTLVK